VTRRPLALDAQESLADLENQVITPAFEERSVYPNPEPNCGCSDRGLGDSTFLVGSHAVHSSWLVGQHHTQRYA
jgi:hypothetical protein